MNSAWPVSQSIDVLSLAGIDSALKLGMMEVTCFGEVSGGDTHHGETVKQETS